MFLTSQIMFCHKYSQPRRKYRSERSNEIKIIVMLITVSPKLQRTQRDINLGFPLKQELPQKGELDRSSRFVRGNTD